MTTRCYFVGFTIASLLFWMMCGWGLQNDVYVISSVWTKHVFDVRQRNLCKKMYGCLEYIHFYFIIDCSLFSCKEMSVQPKCLIEKQRTETHSTCSVYIYTRSSWGASMATKCFLLVHVSFKVGVIFVLDNRKPLHPPPPPPNVWFSKQ